MQVGVEHGVEGLWRACHPWMLRLAWIILGDEVAAQDAVSETWVRCLPRLAPIERPEAYLRTALVRVCFNERRRAGVAERHARRQPERYVVPVAEADVGLVHFVDALAALGPQQRAALVLRYLHGAEDAEIAEALGVRRATVRSHVRHGLARLQEVMT
ncbi:MAG: RNA polymerase sigma factor [Acidimicrobiales bacterium]